MSAGEERAKAYRAVAHVCRQQAISVATSGWGFFSRRCAILNLQGIADLCDDWAHEAEVEIRR